MLHISSNEGLRCDIVSCLEKQPHLQWFRNLATYYNAHPYGEIYVSNIVRFWLWKAIVDKIQTFAYNINIYVGISVWHACNFCMSAVTACSQFELQLFYASAIL